MKISKIAIIAVCLVSILNIGCSNKENDDKLSIKNIENDIPYIDMYSGEIDNNIINARYENVKKEELSYDIAYDYEVEADGKINTGESDRITEVYLAKGYDTNYRSILEGFTYYSEQNPVNLTYDEAIELVKKVLPDDIKQVDLRVDEELNKEYIYYESSKGNFMVGLCYGYEFNDENIEVVNKSKIVGIDYSKEKK